MLAIENKYRIGASIELYNRATVSNFGRVLEALVQSAPLGIVCSSFNSGEIVKKAESHVQKYVLPVANRPKLGQLGGIFC